MDQNKSLIAGVSILELPKILDDRGNLSFLEGSQHIPFEIKRSYWIYDVPGGSSRGGHAFINQDEFIIALSGSFDVTVSDGKSDQKFSLNRSYYGLLIPKMVWRQMNNFSTNSLALVVSNTLFDPNDYIYDKSTFLSLINGR